MQRRHFMQLSAAATMRALTGARTRWVLCASWISRSPIGCISQNVSVKSKGEFWIEQKLLYTRGTPTSSLGTIVKLTDFFSSNGPLRDPQCKPPSTCARCR